jgi:hypothetical protein
VPGDVKQVATILLSDALTHNPGWEYFGSSNQALRGRVLAQATYDAQQTFAVDAGVAQRTSQEVYGETDGVSMDGHTHGGTVAPEPASAVPYPPTIALWTLVKL